MTDSNTYQATYDQSTNLYTVTNSGTGQRVEMTEESFDEFISKMDSTIQDLGYFRDKLLGGTVVTIRENWNQDYLSMGAMQEVDAVNLKLGGFDDALELQEAYRTVFYPSRAEQLDRVYHGLNTGRVISEDIKTSYIENDGAVSADVVTVQNEFDSRGTGINANDVAEVQAENSRGTDVPAGTEPGTEEAPPML
ncbi:hypothetical protein K3N28_12300 [Glycomyces sp. TRM65418]|uniref:hypothetical protein n=1 Tax=Glycomyces sp. TRM65418 TaxID=2867006 RepID=UPI001CE69B4D|nr:hypothetical protein [Glycomyces sp. TRM65418]MCC3763847.1 hypothetical protein [Glycomyces sp. TRM65418]QZD53551.1 hypothetical protein K3N28_12230 [Glycomyces sp. TRM65418]